MAFWKPVGQATQKHFLTGLSLLFLSFNFSMLEASEAPGAREIMEKAHHRMLYQGNSMRIRTKMVTIDKNGNKRKRQFIGLRMDKSSPEQEQDRGFGEQFYYLYFQRPGDIKDTVFLVHKKNSGMDDRWMYLPALDLVKRIAAGDKRTSFVGTTFFYEDVSGRHLDEDNHQLMETTQDYFVIKSEPVDADSVEFSFYKTWVHRGSFIPVSIEYFNKSGEKYRFFENLKVETIDGKPTVTEGRLTNLVSNEVTDFKLSKVAYDKNLSPEIFTKRYLRNPPKQHFK